jgi:hypothetical protein
MSSDSRRLKYFASMRNEPTFKWLTKMLDTTTLIACGKDRFGRITFKYHRGTMSKRTGETMLAIYEAELERSGMERLEHADGVLGYQLWVVTVHESKCVHKRDRDDDDETTFVRDVYHKNDGISIDAFAEWLAIL